ncbi:MAG: glycosyltransferase family 39 protein [Deltaproteobacteria bacterium]|nr:glycosyltransferase family 39 protein [Deltaproteobacteria bacterium]
MIIAFVPRLLFGFQQSELPTYERLQGGDSIFYHRVAAGEATPQRAYFHSPLYQHFVAGVYAATGPQPGAVRWLQHALGILAAYLAYLLALRLFARPVVALLAGVLVALLGPAIFYEGHLIPAGVVPVLMMLFALALERYVRAPSARRALLLGALIGVNALARGTALIWLPLVLLLGWRRPRLARQGALLLGATLLIAPVTARNLLVEGDLVLISANAGLNFYIGNHQRAQGSYHLPPVLWFTPGDPGDDFAGFGAVAHALGHTPSSSEASRWWAGEAWSFIRQHPGHCLGLLGQKTLLWFHHAELPQLYNYRAYQLALPFLRYLPPAGPMLLFGLVGLMLLVARRRSDDLALRTYALAALLFVAAFIPFFIVGRYRAPWLVFIAPAAAFAAVQALEGLFRFGKKREGRRGILALYLALGAAALLVFWPRQEPTRAPQFLSFGRVALHVGDVAGGQRWLGMAIAEAPAQWAGRAAAERLASSLLQSKDPAARQRSHAVLSQGLAHHPKAPRLLALWGRYQLLEGRLTQAEVALQRAIDTLPSEPAAWIDLAQVKLGQGQREAAIAACRSALTLDPKNVKAQRLLQGLNVQP